jgi:hypothetical protein
MADLSTLHHNGRPAGAVDCPVHAASSAKSRIGRIHDGIGFFPRNIPLKDSQR